jgi:hypothetical protein
MVCLDGRTIIINPYDDNVTQGTSYRNSFEKAPIWVTLISVSCIDSNLTTKNLSAIIILFSTMETKKHRQEHKFCLIQFVVYYYIILATTYWDRTGKIWQVAYVNIFFYLIVFIWLPNMHISILTFFSCTFFPLSFSINLYKIIWLYNIHIYYGSFFLLRFFSSFLCRSTCFKFN